MRKMLICSKKSVRTLKFLIEPYFLSHAERGKPFWILDSAGIQPQCRAFGATAFLARIRILNFGGGGEIRTHGALRHSCFQDRCTKPLCDASYYFIDIHAL